MNVRRLMLSLIVALTTLGLASTSASAAEKYEVDPVHSNVLFKAKHLGVAWVYGQFLKTSGEFTYDGDDASNNSVKWEVEAGSVFTNNKKRDDHLRSSDFLNAKQFPKITFESTGVKEAGDDELEVTGKLTLHGVTKEITTTVKETGAGEGPQGKFRRGFHTKFAIDRTDYGIKTMPGGISNEIKIIVSVEGVRQ